MYGCRKAKTFNVLICLLILGSAWVFKLVINIEYKLYEDSFGGLFANR